VRLPVRVVFVCVGNSCRSPIAEGFARARHAGVIDARSAGTHPAPIIQPQTIVCMKQKGISLEGLEPKPLQAIDWQDIDIVVNMSGLPILGMLPNYKGHSMIWAVEDPIGKPMQVYQRARDRIEQLVDQLAAMLRAHVEDQAEV
jgi:arsenate reductase